MDGRCNSSVLRVYGGAPTGRRCGVSKANASVNVVTLIQDPQRSEIWVSHYTPEEPMMWLGAVGGEETGDDILTSTFGGSVSVGLSGSLLIVRSM